VRGPKLFAKVAIEAIEAVAPCEFEAEGGLGDGEGDADALLRARHGSHGFFKTSHSLLLLESVHSKIAAIR
jgi:hypothetical protein